MSFAEKPISLKASSLPRLSDKKMVAEAATLRVTRCRKKVLAFFSLFQLTAVFSKQPITECEQGKLMSGNRHLMFASCNLFFNIKAPRFSYVAVIISAAVKYDFTSAARV
jgi:hypothetical protein